MTAQTPVVGARSASALAEATQATTAVTTAAPPCLIVRDLHAGYGAADVLHGVDLTLAPGRSMCLVGPNGAGKSTVLNAVFGLAQVHRGQIRVGAIDVLPLSAAARLRDAGVAYVLQEDAIFPDLSVAQNLRLGGHLMRGRRELQDAVERILQQHPRLAERRNERAGVLSGGERRSLEIVRALMMQPRLLLIDEPSIGLEPRAVAQVFELLAALVATGTSVLLVEQNVKAGLAFADEGLVLVEGRVALRGPGPDLWRDQAVAPLFFGR